MNLFDALVAVELRRIQYRHQHTHPMQGPPSPISWGVYPDTSQSVQMLESRVREYEAFEDFVQETAPHVLAAFVAKRRMGD